VILGRLGAKQGRVRCTVVSVVGISRGGRERNRKYKASAVLICIWDRGGGM